MTKEHFIKTFFNILKYAVLVISDAICFFGLMYIAKHVSAAVGEVGLFDSGDVFMMCAYPVWFVIRGVLTRTLIKQIWIPSVLLFVFLWIGVPLLSGDHRFKLLFSSAWLFGPACSLAITTVSAIITDGVIRIINVIKKRKKIKNVV